MLDYKEFDNFFCNSLQHKLAALFNDTTQRKLDFILSEKELPDPIITAVEFAEKELNLKFNFVRLKRYISADPRQSGAYEFHIDPLNFRSIPLVLHNVCGNADFDFIDRNGKTCQLKCNPNKLILLNAELKHRVSKPTNVSGIRILLFLAYDDDLD